jgi:hypothetical protein
LKHRPKEHSRRAPAHPELVAILRRHVEHFQLGPEGRLFVTRTGRAGVPLPAPFVNPVSMNTIYRAWAHSRQAVLTPEQVASPLGRRPCDLRHACLSTWLNAGVPPAQVAEWAGHSVHVLLQVHAKCVDGEAEISRRRIESALDEAKLPHAFRTDTRKQPDMAGQGQTRRRPPICGICRGQGPSSMVWQVAGAVWQVQCGRCSVLVQDIGMGCLATSE